MQQRQYFAQHDAPGNNAWCESGRILMDSRRIAWLGAAARGESSRPTRPLTHRGRLVREVHCREFATEGGIAAAPG